MVKSKALKKFEAHQPSIDPMALYGTNKTSEKNWASALKKLFEIIFYFLKST